MNSAASLTLYVFAFFAIWWGAGLIIQSIDSIAKKLKLSSFAISFFVLGLLTSIPETALSARAVLDHKPEIFVGTLLGGVVVIFLLVIPVLAIFGKGIKINHDLSSGTILLSLIVVAMPSLLVIDHRVTNFEGFVLLIAYLGLFVVIQSKHGIFDSKKVRAMKSKAYSFFDLVRVIAGTAIVFISSNYIVDQTIGYSDILGIPVFYISLLTLAIGTNLPELSLAVRAVLSGKNDIAFGDYLGSAAANTLLFGIFTIANDGEVLTTDNFLTTFLFIALGLGLFFKFSQSKKNISIREGAILLGVYICFFIFEAWKAFG